MKSFLSKCPFLPLVLSKKKKKELKTAMLWHPQTIHGVMEFSIISSCLGKVKKFFPITSNLIILVDIKRLHENDI